VRAISDLERGIHRVPRLETVRLLADALALDAAGRTELLAAARPQDMAPGPREGERTHPPVVLPVPPTRLIGREAEVAAIAHLLAQDDVRLVTLTGPGGTGKTRLALEVAAGALARYPDGVCFVDLSALTDPTLVVPTIAATLGVRDVAGQPLLQTLSHAVRPKRMLLLLDNCEQVLAAAPDVAALLATSPRLAVLATSRASLRIRGEHEFPLLPLPAPAADPLPPLEALAQAPSVALFVDLASASRPDFALTAENAAAVAAICRRLDGLPLAIELAAARVTVLPPATLLARLEQRLPLLTGGRRDMPARQRTMQDAIAWSYDLLAPEEQALFRRLAVFAGGFTLAAAEAVVEPNGGSAVLDGVAALVEQSLLRQASGAGDEPRYRMLETIREYGLGRLTAAGEAAAARARHARFVLTLSDSLVHGHGLMDLTILRRLTPDQDNVRLALAWFDEHDEVDALLVLSSVLSGLWLAHGQYREGLRWLERALERSGGAPCAGRVRALVAATMLATFQGDYARAEASSPEAVALARELGEQLLLGQALRMAGLLAYRRGEYLHAEELLTESCARLSRLGDHVPAAVADTGFAFLVLGSTAIVQEQFDRAASWYEASLERFRRAGSDWGIGEVHAALGAVSYCTGDVASAAVHYAASLGRAGHLQQPLLAVSSLNGLAGVAAASGQPEAGARLLGAAEGLASSLGAPAYPRDRPVIARALAALTAALGPEQLTAAREAGQDLTLEAAMAEGHAVAGAVASSPR
jgi:predicted ATPase